MTTADLIKISPSVVNELFGESKIYLTIGRYGISFSKDASKLLALKIGSRFILYKNDLGDLFYQDAVGNDSFVIETNYKPGGCGSRVKSLNKYLGFNDSRKYSIGSLLDGFRKLEEIKTSKKKTK